MDQRQLQVVRVDHSSAWSDALPSDPSAVMLWVFEGAASSELQHHLCRAIVESGSTWAVCGGYQCEDWHDALEWIGAIASVDGLQRPTLMSTGHHNESAETVADFFATYAGWPSTDFRRILILVGGDEAQQEELLKVVTEAIERHAA